MIVYAIKYKTFRTIRTDAGQIREDYWVWYSGNGYGVLQCYATEGKAKGVAKRYFKENNFEIVPIEVPDIS